MLASSERLPFVHYNELWKSCLATPARVLFPVSHLFAFHRFFAFHRLSCPEVPHNLMLSNVNIPFSPSVRGPLGHVVPGLRGVLRENHAVGGRFPLREFCGMPWGEVVKSGDFVYARATS
jgi:hypothetical protein